MQPPRTPLTIILQNGFFLKRSIFFLKPDDAIQLKLPDYEERKHELEIIERLCAIGLKPDPTELARHFAFPLEGAGKSAKKTGTKDADEGEI